MNRPRLILASASPRRRRLLTWAGLDFDTLAVDVDESLRAGEAPIEYARRLARAKAETAAENKPQDWVLAADTIVTVDGVIMGKPADRHEAADMLGALSGKTHQVVTAFSLVNRSQNTAAVEHVVTDVRFRPLSTEDIFSYIDSDEAWDKAGAYAVQGRGASLTDEVRGSFTNVIGLPLAEVLACLNRFLGPDRRERGSENS